MKEADDEESEILKVLESGKVKRATDATEIQKRHQLYAEAMLKEDQEDLKVYVKRKSEPTITHEELLNDLKAHGKL